MHSKNISFALFTVLTLTVAINCSEDSFSPPQPNVSFRLPSIAPQDLLIKGLTRHDYGAVKYALEQQANPNEIIDITSFGDRSCFNAYLARARLNPEIVALMLDNGAHPTVDTDRIIDQKPRDNLKTVLRILVAKQRQASHRADFLARISAKPKTITTKISTTMPPRHVDPMAS